MPRTFTTIQTEALGNDFSLSVFPGTQVGTWINDGLKEIARRVDLPASEASSTLSVVSGTQAYNLPADFVRVIDLSDTTSDDLLTEHDLEWLDDQDTATGIPTDFVLSGSQLVLYPTPNLTSSTRFTLRYVKVPVDIAGATGVTGTIPDDYGDLLVSYARWHMFRAEDDFEMAQAWKGEFEEGLRKLRLDVGGRSAARRQVPGMWERGSAPSFVRPG